MKPVLAAALISLSASAAYAECGHQTTAQSNAPDLVVAQDAAAPMTIAPEGVDDMLTGSTEDDLLKKKLLEEQDAE